ncbi:DUF1772 domain-containing protein [Chelativorans salis]|uniref:DUF1772 domain-containing protein n=1 Tax=Chelativorans salis TaxID=2978478 RepID=A0ABT2LHJ9_9HYPH|nr:DUF1772 domain-containing protein [Chelativorans sp. EGI FJ00035]MCT7373965.1 DUF1772 domain-containing protein [Chelativorans sp. EGI FJ00035]
MAIKTVQFLAIILIALALVPGGAHLIELPNKIGMDREQYLTVQQIYRGWALAGFVLIGALATTLALAILSRSQGPPFLFATASFLLLLTTLATFFIWVFPVNQATHNWTTAPKNWQALRTQWETMHAINAVITFAGLVSAVISTMTWSDS